jgi:cyclophilin family peptidyl-prolyl cis-trans isomerase
MRAKITIFAGLNSNGMKRIAYMLVMALMMTGCNQASKDGDNKEISTNNMETTKNTQPIFDILTTYGTMRVQLYDKTPQHRDNFVKLVSEKYYDGMRFHRVIEGFMIQAGDPFSRDVDKMNKWGTGGPNYTVPAEFVSEYTHKKGALAAARKGDLANPKKASSGSQFYIVHDEYACAPLDGEYTVFGEVIEGLDVIDAIATTATDRYDRPYDDVIITAIVPFDESETEEETTAPADTTKVE